MNREQDQLEILWDGLLSRQPEVIKAAYATLDAAGQKAVLAHLQSMTNEKGWQPEQRCSARAALKAIAQLPGQEQ